MNNEKTIPLSWRTEKRKVSELIPIDYNPRILSSSQKKLLIKSLQKFNLAEIPAINTDNKILAVIHFPHSKNKRIKKIHRLVVLPDYQGLGIGKVFLDFVAKIYTKKGADVAITTSHPALAKSLFKNNNWFCTRNTRNTRNKGYLGKNLNKTLSSKRITYTFKFYEKKN